MYAPNHEELVSRVRTLLPNATNILFDPKTRRTDFFNDCLFIANVLGHLHLETTTLYNNVSISYKNGIIEYHFPQKYYDVIISINKMFVDKRVQIPL